MTAAGWILMILTVGTITSLLVWCVYKVIRTPDASEHLHAPLDADIDTHDSEAGP